MILSYPDLNHDFRDNNSVDFESGITANDMFDVKNDIMRRVKFKQLRTRLVDFKRRAKIILREK